METTIELTINATSPCAKFLGCSPRDQIQKIKEEVLEVEEALDLLLEDGITAEEKEKAALEVLVEMYDVIACVNTLHRQLISRYPELFNDSANESAQLCVLHKNMKRGYYTGEE